MQYYDTSHTERCVSCDINTNVPKALDITYRKWYIQGAGQLCEECYNFLYPKKQVKLAEEAWSY